MRGANPPNVSLMKMSTSKAMVGAQKYGRSKNGSWDRCGAGVRKYCHTPMMLTPTSGEIAVLVTVASALVTFSPLFRACVDSSASFVCAGANTTMPISRTDSNIQGRMTVSSYSKGVAILTESFLKIRLRFVEAACTFHTTRGERDYGGITWDSWHGLCWVSLPVV